MAAVTFLACDAPAFARAHLWSSTNDAVACAGACVASPRRARCVYWRAMSARAVSTDAAHEVLLASASSSSDAFRKRALVGLGFVMMLIIWRVVIGAFSLNIDPTTMKMTQSFMSGSSAGHDRAVRATLSLASR